MTLREWIRIAVALALAWFIWWCVRRRELKRGIWSVLGVLLVILFGVFVVFYGRLWHAWIFPARAITKTH